MHIHFLIDKKSDAIDSLIISLVEMGYSVTVGPNPQPGSDLVVSDYPATVLKEAEVSALAAAVERAQTAIKRRERKASA